MYKFAKINIFLMLIASFSIVQGKAQNVNFSGEWSRNTEKSSPGQLSINSIPIRLKIEQNTQKIIIKRTSKNRMNDTSVYSEELSFDGAISEATIKSNLKKKSSIQWPANQNELVETAVYIDLEGKQVQTSKETWALMEGGKSLKISCVLEVGGQTFAMEEVFDKQ